MKKYLCLALAVLCLLGLTACGSSAQAQSETTAQVDYDLTQMSSDMVYALVYQMMQSPEAYMGKTVQISGQYYASYYTLTQQYYHYCLIADATACCSSGIEFIWGAGEHSLREDYPEDGAQILVTGTFGSYDELGITYYCLLDATMEISA